VWNARPPPGTQQAEYRHSLFCAVQSPPASRIGYHSECPKGIKDDGMTTNEWLTLAAIVLGPILAVGVTLWIEERRQTRGRQLHIVRMLLMTRHMPADPQYNAAINLIPIEFNDQEKVMDAWRTYHERVRQTPSPEQVADHQKRVSAAQSGMIFQVMRSAGLTNLSEGDIQTQAYVSQGFVDRDTVYVESLRALPAIAATMEKQRELTQRIVDALPQRPPAQPQVPEVRQ
jgi:hypothetical protein